MNIQKPVKRATEVTEPGAVASGTKAQPDQSVIDSQNDSIVEPYSARYRSRFSNERRLELAAQDLSRSQSFFLYRHPLPLHLTGKIVVTD